VLLYSDFADAERTADLLVQQAANYERHYFPFAMAEGLDQPIHYRGTSGTNLGDIKSRTRVDFLIFATLCYNNYRRALVANHGTRCHRRSLVVTAASDWFSSRARLGGIF
jgi:hypothetical protein